MSMKAHALSEHIKVLAAGCAVSATAGGAGDAGELTGEVIDRDGFHSCVLVVPYKTALSAGKLLALTVKVAESDDGSSFGADQTLANAVTVASSVAGGTIEDAYKLKVDLSGSTVRKRYLKFKVTPNLDAANTDTAILAAAVILGGPADSPVAAWAAATA